MSAHPLPAGDDDTGEHELRCAGHLHAKIVAGVQEIRCHQCSKRRRATVTHRFRLVVETLEDRVEDPKDAAA